MAGTYKRLYFFGSTAYVVMLMLSALFYKERIIFIDTAYTIFHIVKDNTFSIETFRFGEIATQVLPVLTRKPCLPLNVITLSYSIGFVLYYFTCYVIAGSVLKRYDFALIILLLNILFVSDTFFWIQSELPQSIALLMVVFAFVSKLEYKNTKLFTWLLLLVSLSVLAFFHPLLVFVIIYCSIFFLNREQAIIDRRLLFAILIFYCTAVLIKALLFRTTYETHSFSGLKNFVALFPDYFSIYSNKRFLNNILSKYYWILLFFLTIVVFYCTKKEWRKLVVFISFFGGYLMLINVSYPTKTTAECYMENLYLPLSVFLSLPLVFDMLPLLKQKQGASLVMAILVLSCTFRIYSTSTKYVARLNWERSFLSKNENKKLIVDAARAKADILEMLWGTPYEFWLLSTIEKGTSASIIIDETPAQRAWASEKKKSLIVNWNIYPYTELNPKYFHFTDTTSGYIVDQ